MLIVATLIKDLKILEQRGVPVCVFVCVCIYVHPLWRLHMSGVGDSGNRSAMLCWRHFFPLPSLFIATLLWSIKPFWLAALSCSHTRGGTSLDLTSFMCVLLSKTWGLHLLLSGIAFGPHYIVSRSAYCVRMHARGRNLIRKS